MTNEEHSCILKLFIRELCFIKKIVLQSTLANNGTRLIPKLYHIGLSSTNFKPVLRQKIDSNSEKS